MAASVPPKAVGKVLADSVEADAHIFEQFVQHYMGIIVSKKKWQNCLPRTGVRRSERLIAKRKITKENVCTKKIKTKKTLSKAKRRVPFHKLCITPRENIVQVSDDDDLEIIDPVPEPARIDPQMNSNNNHDEEVMLIDVDSSSEDETEQNERKSLRLLENERGRHVPQNGGASNQTEDNLLQNEYITNGESLYETVPCYSLYQSIEQDASSSSSIRSTSTTIGYSYPQIMTSHAAYTQNREQYAPIGGLHNRFQEMSMAGAAPYSNLFACNESQQRMTPSTPLSFSTPEQAAHCFSEELPSNSAHCVFQVNQLTELPNINDRPTRNGIFSIFFGNNQQAHINGYMLYNSEEDRFQFDQHFFNQPRMSNYCPYQNFNRNYDSQHHHVNQTHSYQPSGHEYEPVNYEDQNVTINNTDNNYTQRGQSNMECSLSSPMNSKYETIEIIDSDDECADESDVSEVTCPAAGAATDSPRLNLMGFMTMLATGELTAHERGRINALRPDPLNGNIRLRIDLQENAADDNQTVSRSIEWDNLGYSHVFTTVTYKVKYGSAPGEEEIEFNNVVFNNGNQQHFYRCIPWLLGIRHFISRVVDCEEIP